MKRTTVLNFRTCLEKASQINGIGFYVNTKIRRFRVKLVMTTSIRLQNIGHEMTLKHIILGNGMGSK